MLQCNSPSITAIPSTAAKSHQLWQNVVLGSCRYDLTSHDKPRLSAFVDKEQQHASVQITFNHQRQKVNTVAGFVAFLKDGLFQVALNNRLFKMGRKPDPPFWIAQVTSL